MNGEGEFGVWTRKELKDRAKQVLRTSYWKAFLVSLLLAFLTGGVPGCSFNSNFGGHGTSGTGLGVHDGMGAGTNGAFSPAMIAIFAIVFIIIILALTVGLAIRIFLISPLEVGVRQYFKQSALGEVNMNHLGHSFSKGRYLPVVKAMFWRGLLNVLWFLLLIVPGIVKSYAYSMVPYILADNPNIGTRRAVELSNRMTRGEKWNMFVLDLSFIGWYLLGMIALFVGVLFVLPYVNATKAELYLVLRRQAVDNGVCSRPELGLSEFE
jgi:uncharacterized membrane protein